MSNISNKEAAKQLDLLKQEAESLLEWICFSATRLNEYGLNSDRSDLINDLERDVPKLSPLLSKLQELESLLDSSDE